LIGKLIGSSMFLIFLRSLVFNVLFYAVLVCLAIVALPTFAMPPRALLTVAGWWAQATRFLMRVICNIKVEFRCVEKIPSGPLVVVAKHQSFWETFALMPFFDHPIFILKRQLMHIPVFGQFLAKIGMISIDRGAGVKALLDMTRRRTTRPALPRSIRLAACNAFRSHSTPACSGRAAPSCAIRERWWWNFWIRCRRACRRTSTSRACATRSRARPAASLKQGGRSKSD
jgi:hypothetical protein